MIELPDIVIIEKYESIGISRVKLDWSNFEKESIKRTIDFIIRDFMNFGESYDKVNGKKIKIIYRKSPNLIKETLMKLDWKTYLQPTHWEEVEEITNNFLIKEDYLTQLLKLKTEIHNRENDLPTNEFELSNILHSITVKLVESFFMIISSSLNDNNSISNETCFKVICLNLWRFWRTQTEASIIIKRSFNLPIQNFFILESSFLDLKKSLEKDLLNHWLPGHKAPPPGSTSGDPRYEIMRLLFNFIKSNIREKKISEILD